MSVDRGADWRAWAACQQYPEDLWTADVGRQPRSPWLLARQARAKAICGRCPVRAECLQSALSVPADLDRAGVYGGLDPAERKALRPAPGERLRGADRQSSRHRTGAAGPAGTRGPRRGNLASRMV
ncbi:MAG: WhiB family transcriptional regulator [Acidobacteriota bacterium]|nr:WhiB family transcriptional regulator [Acidobacteriota bacterium]